MFHLKISNLTLESEGNPPLEDVLVHGLGLKAGLRLLETRN